jgi:hypothetical protein
MHDRPKSKIPCRMSFTLLGALLGISIPIAAGAQSGVASDADLRGVTGLRVTLSPMSAASMECDLRGAELVSDTQTKLATGGMTAPRGDDALAIVTVITGRDGTSGLCSSALMLGAYERASYVDDHVGWVRTGYVVLWQSGLMVTSAPQDHLDTVRRALDELGSAMLEEWHRANAVQ